MFVARLFNENLNSQAPRTERRALIPNLVGAFLLIASALKGYDLATVPTTETNLYTSHWFLIAVVEAEFALGLWLISGLLSLFVRWTALGAFVVFFFISVSKALAGETNCGCFGPVPANPRYTAGLDFGVVLSLYLWHPTQNARNAAGSLLFRGAAILALLLFVGVPGGIILGAIQPGEIGNSDGIDANQAVVLLEPEKWVGRRCPILKYIDIGHELSHGSWLVVLYHHDCPHCRELVPEYEAKARVAANGSTSPKTAFLAVPPHGDPL